MAFVLKSITKDKLTRLLNARPAAAAERGRGKVWAELPVMVRCTSGTAVGGSAVGNQCWPAVVVKPNSLVSTQETGAEVWLTVLEDVDTVVTPVAGQVYFGLYTGFFDASGDERLRVFSVSGSSGSGDGSACGGGCGWVTGLDTDWCLYLSVMSAAGACADLDTTQEIQLEWDATTHWLGVDDFDYPGGSGAVDFWVDSEGQPRLTIDGIELSRACCGDGYAEFVGGPLIGLCDGDPPATACDPNTFRARVACAECDCSIPGWDVAGWYCILVDGECTAVELLDEDRCDDTIVICDGPYADEATAAAACGSLGACCYPATTYAFTVAGVTDAACHCTGLNRSWTLAGGAETTAPSTTTSCTVGFPADTAGARMVCDEGGGVMKLFFDNGTSGSVAEYRLALSSWNCDGANVMSLFANDGSCGGWPATLTVTAST